MLGLLPKGWWLILCPLGWHLKRYRKNFWKNDGYGAYFIYYCNGCGKKVQ